MKSHLFFWDWIKQQWFLKCGHSWNKKMIVVPLYQLLISKSAFCLHTVAEENCLFTLAWIVQSIIFCHWFRHLTHLHASKTIRRRITGNFFAISSYQIIEICLPIFNAFLWPQRPFGQNSNEICLTFIGCRKATSLPVGSAFECLCSMVSYGSKLAEFHAKPSFLIHHFLRDFPNKNGCLKGSRNFLHFCT